MPINNFKLFDENKANMMTDDDYAINQQRLNGVQSGVASSQLQNKTLYQTALMCYALAQLMAANGYDANDANAVSTFVNNLSSSVLQKVVDKASATDIKNKVANKWVDSSIFGQNMENLAETYLKLAGGTMTGDLILHSDPTQNLQAATKQYVDNSYDFGSFVGTGRTTVGTIQTLNFTRPRKVILFFNVNLNENLYSDNVSRIPFIQWYQGVRSGYNLDYDYIFHGIFAYVEGMPKRIITGYREGGYGTTEILFKNEVNKFSWEYIQLGTYGNDEVVLDKKDFQYFWIAF